MNVMKLSNTNNATAGGNADLGPTLSELTSI
jgi:hypothetical protein